MQKVKKMIARAWPEKNTLLIKDVYQKYKRELAFILRYFLLRHKYF